MSLLDLPIPPKPTSFDPFGAPPGIATDFKAFHTQQGSDWWRVRPVIEPRSILVHTNAASVESLLQGQINWGNRSPFGNTHPHYAFNRPQPTKLVPSNRRGIGNWTVAEWRGDHGNITDWSLVLETADIGWNAASSQGVNWPTDCGPYLHDHDELVARAIAYEAILHDIPIAWLRDWWGAGIAAHTHPFGYPYTTKHQGKTCPGATKKWVLGAEIMPRAAQLRHAWTTPTPTPTPTPPAPTWPLRYVVKPLDSYWGISREVYGYANVASVQALQDANEEVELKAGMILYVPGVAQL